jgi:hypothetical protein
MGEGHGALRDLSEAPALGLPVDLFDGLLPQRRGSAAQISRRRLMKIHVNAIW